MTDPRTPVFDAVRSICPAGVFNSPENIQALHNLLDAFGAKREGNSLRSIHNKEAFFQLVRKITGPLKQQQVESIEGILRCAAHWTVGQVAYALATGWHEARFIPQDEIGKGKGKAYGKPGKYGHVPYGRGLVQLTWDQNYEWADRLCTELGLIQKGEILKDFSLALRPDIAAMVLVRGMEKGAFGRKLPDIVGDLGTKESFKQARRSVNVMDKAELIAGYALQFQEAVLAGGWK